MTDTTITYQLATRTRRGFGTRHVLSRVTTRASGGRTAYVVAVFPVADRTNANDALDVCMSADTSADRAAAEALANELAYG